MSYTVNIRDRYLCGMKNAKLDGLNAYHADGITAIETRKADRVRARIVAKRYGLILHIFE